MKRQKHNLSHYKLLTCDMGELVPIGVQEVLPGDTIQQATSALIRVSPLATPVMHPVQVKIHHWFVPTRQIWSDFEKFITGGADGNDASVPPYFNNYEVTAGSLADYLGLPVASDVGDVSALPFRAYAKIYNEFYRDQDLQTELTIALASGADSTTSDALQNINWEKDYFTSARPWTQKGAEATIGLSGTAPVLGIGANNNTYPSSAGSGIHESDGTTSTYANYKEIGSLDNNKIFYVEENGTTGYPNIRADFATANATIGILELREMFALQKYAEARAKYGSRYVEYLRSLGVRSSDGRLDRPEYLGGGKQTIQFSEVLQTGGTSAGAITGVGQIAGHGIGALRSNRYRKFFEEHGYIITLMAVKPRTMYCQGVNKMWTRQTKEDYFQKELQYIGQAEVLNKEVYVDHATPDGVFGYQDRYDEYRRVESGIAGEFRDTLDDWHMGRIFASDPALNDDFVKAVPTKRVHQVQNADVLWIMANHSIQARRMVGKG